MLTHRMFFKDRKKVFTDPGSRTKPEYSAHYDEAGNLVLDEVGTVDVYADIQSYLDTVEIHTLLRRFQNGETDVFSKVQGFYADVSDLPKSNVEFLNRVLESQEFFASLPPEVKEVYGNDYVKFMADFDSNELYRSLGLADPVDDVKEPEPEPEPVKKSTRKTTKKTEVLADEE